MWSPNLFAQRHSLALIRFCRCGSRIDVQNGEEITKYPLSNNVMQTKSRTTPSGEPSTPIRYLERPNMCYLPGLCTLQFHQPFGSHIRISPCYGEVHSLSDLTTGLMLCKASDFKRLLIKRPAETHRNISMRTITVKRLFRAKARNQGRVAGRNVPTWWYWAIVSRDRPWGQLKDFYLTPRASMICEWRLRSTKLLSRRVYRALVKKMSRFCSRISNDKNKWREVDKAKQKNMYVTGYMLLKIRVGR